MKFNKGHWQLQPETLAIYPVSIVDIRIEPDALIVTGYDHAVHSRGDYLGGVEITVRL